MSSANGHKPDDSASVDDVLFALMNGGGKILASWLKGVYLDGQEFATHEDSIRWQLWIKDQEFFRALSVLWSIANLDSFVLNADDPTDLA
jgi:hypothetical protein